MNLRSSVLTRCLKRLKTLHYSVGNRYTITEDPLYWDSILNTVSHIQSKKGFFFSPKHFHNIHHFQNVVCFLLGNSPASEFYMPTFRNTMFHLHRQVGVPMKMEQIVF